MAWALEDRQTRVNYALKNGDTLGREGTHVFKLSPLMSRLHCKISIENDICFIEDLGSKNGTIVDGKPCLPNQRTMLKDGALVTFGGTDFKAKRTEKDRTNLESKLTLEEPTRTSSLIHPALHKEYTPNKIHSFAYDGSFVEIFGLSLKNIVLTLLTLGLYIPFAKTNMRKYIWKNCLLNNEPFQFKGSGKKLFKSYLVALLAIIIAVSFFGAVRFYFFKEDKTAEFVFSLFINLISIFILMKIRWNSYTYLLKNTRYRSISFALRSQGANEYFKESLKTSVLILLTLGFYYPYWVYKADKLKWNNTFFGNIPFIYRPDRNDFIKKWYEGAFYCVVSLGLYTPWFIVSIHNYKMSRLKIMDAKFVSKADGASYAFVLLKSFFILILSLGTASAYIFDLNFAYFINNLTLRGSIDFDQVIQGLIKASDQPGFNAIQEVFDVDGIELI